MEKLEQTLEDWYRSSEEYEDEINDSTIEEEVEQLEETITNQGIEGLKNKLHENAEKWKKVPINIAVTGSSGAGKSSFVNAFLGLSEEDEDSAKVGEKETTTDLKSYYNSKRPNLKLWDMPGVGTPKHPKGGYLEEVKFDQYDFFLILSNSRFADNDLWLATEIQNRNKRFYFIRTCIDSDISNNARRTKSKHNPEMVKSSVRDDIMDNLVAAKIKNPMIFLVDNLDPRTHEFQDVDRQLLNDCDDLKKEAMVLSLSTLTTKVFSKKKEILKKRSFEKAMAVACEYTSRNTQVQLFNEEIKFQAEQFGVDMETVLQNKDILNISEENMQKCKDLLEKFPLETRKKIPMIRLWSFYRRLILRLFGVTEMPEYSVGVFKFCSLSFEQNIDKMYQLALDMYNLKAQEAIVETYCH